MSMPNPNWKEVLEEELNRVTKDAQISLIAANLQGSCDEDKVEQFYQLGYMPLSNKALPVCPVKFSKLD